MKNEIPTAKKNAFESFASAATKTAGSTTAFILAFIIIITWLITGPIFNYSDTWQLAINTGTTIITFLMVFLIQKTQNKDTIVVQIKLNELVAASEFASNRIVSIEDLTEAELHVLHKYYSKLAQLAKSESNLQTSHSIDEAKIKNRSKHTKRIMHAMTETKSKQMQAAVKGKPL